MQQLRNKSINAQLRCCLFAGEKRSKKHQIPFLSASNKEPTRKTASRGKGEKRILILIISQVIHFQLNSNNNNFRQSSLKEYQSWVSQNHRRLKKISFLASKYIQIINNNDVFDVFELLLSFFVCCVCSTLAFQ